MARLTNADIKRIRDSIPGTYGHRPNQDIVEAQERASRVLLRLMGLSVYRGLPACTWDVTSSYTCRLDVTEPLAPAVPRLTGHLSYDGDVPPATVSDVLAWASAFATSRAAVGGITDRRAEWRLRDRDRPKGRGHLYLFATLDGVEVTIVRLFPRRPTADALEALAKLTPLEIL